MKKQIITALSLMMPFIAEAALTVTDGRIRLLPPGVPNTAAYAKVVNDTDETVAIVGASSDVATRVELHNHVMKDGMMSMQKLSEVPLPAGETVRFRPGGYHIMLFDLKQPLSPNQAVTILLRLDNGETVELLAEPRKPQSEHHH